MSKPMTFEERFEKTMDSKAEVYAEETNDYYIIHGKRKSIYETYMAAVEDLKPIIIEMREALVAIQEYMVDEQGNSLTDRDANTKQVRIARAAQARLDEFFGGMDE